MQPDVGTLIILTAISLGVYFMAGVDIKQFGIIILVLIIGLAAAIYFEPYRFDRIKILCPRCRRQVVIKS